MNALVLSAGLGTRLLPLTRNIPKPCLPLINRPMIIRILDSLHSGGISRFGINLHHAPEVLTECVNRSPYSNNCEFTFEPKILGTGGGIANLRRKLFPDHDHLLAVNADGFYSDIPWTDMKNRLIERDLDAVLLCTPSIGIYTTLYSDDAGLLTISPTDNRWTYIGIILLGKKLLDHMPHKPFHLFTDFIFQKISSDRLKIAVWEHAGDWYDLGTPAHYLQSQLDILSKYKDRVVPDNHLFDRDTMSVVTPQTVVPAGCRLNHCIIGDGVNLDPGTIMDHCIVFPETPVARGNYEYSIITPEYTLQTKDS